MYILSRDLSFFCIDFFSGNRSSDLGRTKSKEVLLFPDSPGLLFNHTFGKTLRGNSTHSFSVRSSSNSDICPVRNFMLYLNICRLISVDISQGCSHWGHLVQTPQISSGFKDKNSRALVFSRVFCFSLNVRQSLAWCPSLLPAAMTIVAILASSRSFSPPGSLLPISYPCLGRLGVRAPSGNLLLPSAQRAKRE